MTGGPPHVLAERCAPGAQKRGDAERERSVLRELIAATGGMLPIVVALVVVWAFFQTLNAHFLSPRNLTPRLLQIRSWKTGISPPASCWCC